jgi:uncharacterized OsmC-like protein
MSETSFTPNDLVFTCRGTAAGKMRNELDVRVVHPAHEQFLMATDEGAVHGGESSAPLPLALFVGGLTGCLMTQIRAFAKRMKLPVSNLTVDCEVIWSWKPVGRVYETEPKGFRFDIDLETEVPISDQVALISAAKKGCFIEQTLGRSNQIHHRIKTPNGFVDVEGHK